MTTLRISYQWLIPLGFLAGIGLVHLYYGIGQAIDDWRVRRGPEE